MRKHIETEGSSKFSGVERGDRQGSAFPAPDANESVDRLGAVDSTAKQALDEGPTQYHSNSQQTLIFLHVPKTAGTTLNRIIDTHYNPLRIYSIPGAFRDWSIEKFKRLPESRRLRIQVLRGHMGFGLHRYFPQQSKYLTILREPVSRILSSYHYAASSRLHPLHKVVMAQDFSLDRFLELAPWIHNLQCNLIGGMSMAAVRDGKAVEAATRGDAAAAAELSRLQCDEHVLSEAKANLQKHFSVVGLTEQFNESLALMVLKYGWAVPAYTSFRRSRSKRQKEPCATATRSRIEQLNAFDMELYDFGRGLFRAAVESRREEVEGILKTLQGAKRPGQLRALGGAAFAWSRFGLSVVRSGL
ncbi:MAG: sulfotransferase family 2 domain-containing protein [Candidatus Promineifilaceae bacterium]|jgi:hypothetical protein